jgi:hypothetical protein
LTLELATALTHVSFCYGDTDSISTLVDEILHHGKSLKDKLGAYRSTILSSFQEGDTTGAIEMTLFVLDQLGVHMPRRFIKLSILRRVLRVRRRLQRYSDDDLLALPEMSDENLRQAPAFVALLGAFGMVTGRTDYQHLALIQNISVTLEGVNSDWTVVSFGACGYLFAIFGETDTAYRYGKLALQMVDEGSHSSQDARATVMTYFCVWHWKNPYHDCLGPFLRAYKMALDTGAIEDLFFSIIGYSIVYYHCGLQLDPFEKDMRRFTEVLEDYGQTYFLAIYKTHVQFILNLMGQSDDPTILTGEAMDQEECLRMWTKDPNSRALQLLRLNRMILAYFFDDLPLADKMASELCHPVKFGPGAWLAPRFLFEGLIAFGLAKSTRHRRRYQRRGLRFLRTLEKFVRNGNVNCHHMMLLLRAELASLNSRSDPEKVQRAYGDAIMAAGKLGFMHHQAVGNELAGVYFLEQRKDRAWASTYLSRARELFDQWGAKAKVQHMDKKYNELMVCSNELLLRSRALSARTRFDENQMASRSRREIEFGM